MRAFLGSAIAARLNVADEANWQDVVKLAVDTFGTADILVNNAGVGSRGIIYDQTSKEDFDKIMAINAWGPFAGMKTVAPVMKKAGKRRDCQCIFIGGCSGRRV